LDTSHVVVASANVTSDEPVVRDARGRRDLSQFGTWSANGAYLTSDWVVKSTAITHARRNFPKQSLKYHRAGHDAVASPQIQRGSAAFVHTNACARNWSQWHACRHEELRWRKDDASDKNIAFLLLKDKAEVLVTTRSGRTCRRRSPSLLAK
jgi:ribulose-bisphosphate carboxylase large chain